MFACRLCLRLGIDDPIAWLDSVDDDVFDLWYAYWCVEPWGNETQLAAEIVASTTASAIMAGADAEKTSKFLTSVRNSRMPPNWIDQPPTTEVTIEDTQKMLERMFG